MIIIIVVSMVVYLVGACIISPLWFGYFNHNDLDECKSGSDREFDVKMVAFLFCIFFPITLLIAVIYTMAKKMYNFGRITHISKEQARAIELKESKKRIIEQNKIIAELNKYIELESH